MSTWVAVCCYTLVSMCGLLWRIDSQLPPSLVQTCVHVFKSLSQGAPNDDLSAALKAGDALLNKLLESRMTIFFFVNFVASVYLLSAVLLKTVFLGKLTVLESAKLTERLIKYILSKVVFVGAVVPPTLPDVAKWMSWFLVMGYLKMFLGMSRDRLEGLLSSPTASVTSIVRASTLLAVVLVNDISWLGAYYLQPGKGMSANYMMLWLFDALVIGLEALHTAVKFGIQMGGRVHEWCSERAGMEPGVHWEDGSSMMYHFDLLCDLIIHSLTLAHYWHMWYLHGVAFQLIDIFLFIDIRGLVMALHHRLRSYCHYWNATKRLKHTFQDATPEQLQDCGDCAICRETMTCAKVLPCGHIFHLGCLRAWLQQSGMNNFSCPLCRAPLLPKEPEAYNTPNMDHAPPTPAHWTQPWPAGHLFNLDHWLQVGHGGVHLDVQPGLHPYNMSDDTGNNGFSLLGLEDESDSGGFRVDTPDEVSEGEGRSESLMRPAEASPLCAQPSTVTGNMACRSYFTITSSSQGHTARRMSHRQQHQESSGEEDGEVSSMMRPGSSVQHPRASRRTTARPAHRRRRAPSPPLPHQQQQEDPQPSTSHSSGITSRRSTRHTAAC